MANDGVRRGRQRGALVQRPTRMSFPRGLALALCLLGAQTRAGEAPGGAPSAPGATAASSGFNGDLDLYSDYIGRGLTFSNEKPATQGRIEYDWASGLYGGGAMSDRADILNKETVEIDLYAGYRKQLSDWTVDVGAISWLYPHSRFDVSNNTYTIFEGTVDVTYKVVGVKVWYDVFDYLGLNDESARPNYHVRPNGASAGSSYFDAHLALPLTSKLTLKLHAGYQILRNYGAFDYADVLVGVERALPRGFAVGGAFTDTNANEFLYENPYGLDLARRKWLAYFRWAFP